MLHDKESTICWPAILTTLRSNPKLSIPVLSNNDIKTFLRSIRWTSINLNVSINFLPFSAIMTCSMQMRNGWRQRRLQNICLSRVRSTKNISYRSYCPTVNDIKTTSTLPHPVNQLNRSSMHPWCILQKDYLCRWRPSLVAVYQNKPDFWSFCTLTEEFCDSPANPYPNLVCSGIRQFHMLDSTHQSVLIVKCFGDLVVHAGYYCPDSKVPGAYMGSTWGRQDPDGHHVDPMKLAIRVAIPSCLRMGGKCYDNLVPWFTLKMYVNILKSCISMHSPNINTCVCVCDVALQEENFIEEFITANGIPLFKKDDATVFNNYRWVSMHALQKI